MLSERHLRQAAYVVGEEIARRQRTGIPIPQVLKDLRRALADELSIQGLRRGWLGELSASGHDRSQNAAAPGELESTTDVAERLGISDRSVRRQAAREGVPKVGGRYLFGATGTGN
jgi:hypothetical protein